jgi:crotonobetainyl-CoA:carnitine CoA-transferase CaiB-like acyl-CoA transferase
VLSPYRVLDLTDEDGLLCGQILADLGAEVIQIEPPLGSPARRIGLGERPEVGEDSLFWAAYARNKRSIVLDFESDSDRGVFLKLVAGADFLIESGRPGRMEAQGLGYESLASIQPGLVYVSITPFGRTGPKADWRATDLTSLAAGGFAYLSGESDGPPTRVRVPQAHAQASVDAAVGALIAHARRRKTGRGQHVDVSIQQSVTLANMFRTLDAAVEMAPAQRLAGGMQAGGVRVPIRHRTRDGWVTLGPSILPSTGHFMRRLLSWVAEEGFCDATLPEEDWGKFGLLLGGGRLPRDAYDRVETILDAFFAERDSQEVMREAVRRKLLIAPVLGLDEIMEGEQLAARDYAVRLGREGESATRYPGPFAKFGRTPIRYRRPSPDLDEDGEELRGEATRRPAPTERGEDSELPLAGIKILDLFWVIAGPVATRMLADYGATVIRVESSGHPDTLRVSPPWQYGQPHPEGAAGFQSANANKLGLSLDFSSEQGREILRDLVRWADVVTESFAPGVMAAHGLDWEKLRRIRPDLIMLSSCLMGQTGPWRDFAGFGRLAVSLSGFQRLGSWPDRPPSGPFGAYTDAIAARYNALSILAALEYRDRSGEGQYIDLSQVEASLHFLAPAILDWTRNGRVQGAVGNDDDDCSPHGMFPTVGEDRWVAIAVREDAEFRALCDLLERPDLLSRRGMRDEVDAALASWTRERDGRKVEEALQARGIAAHRALDTPGLFTDPQLRHRNHFLEIGHEIYPSTTIEGSRLSLSDSPARVPGRALSLGRDNRYILESLLDYSAERIEDLESRGVLS